MDVDADPDGHVLTYMRENSHNVLFDFDAGEIVWDDYVGFQQQTVGVYMDIAGIPATDEEGRPYLLSSLGGRNRFGGVTTLNLAERNIPMISPASFSCANLVPWAFKEDGRVTLLGKVSGGGSCVVQPMTTAWGTAFQISGHTRISFVKNGSYYDVDRGVEPDYVINTYNHFFDREALTDFINGLY